MCRLSLVRAFSLAICLGIGLSANADKVVLTDGTVLVTAKPYVIKGNNALLTMRDGTLTSLPASSIDPVATATANAPAPKPVAKPAAPFQPMTPAQAAKTKGRKATVVLADEDVSHPIMGEEGGEAKARGEGKVEVANVKTERTENGLMSISGSVVNTGQSDVLGVSVTIEAVGEGSKTLTTAFGVIAKDSLAPGEKSSFTAEIEDAGISNFRFFPKWQVRAPKAEGGSSGASTGASDAASGGGAAQPGTKNEPAAAPSPAAPAPTPVFTQLPRPDLAAPAANAPIGQPTNPNSGYVPGYSSTSQPKTIIK